MGRKKRSDAEKLLVAGVAIYSAYKRYARKKQKELEVQKKEFDKLKKQEQAVYEVDLFLNNVRLLVSLHEESHDEVNWNEIAQSPEPVKPVINLSGVTKKKNDLEGYVPSFIDRIFRLEGVKRRKFQEALDEEIAISDKQYADELKNYESLHEQWREMTNFAHKIQSGNVDAYIEVLDRSGPLEEIENLGESIDITIENDFIDVLLVVNGEQVIPDKIKRTIKRRPYISQKKMTKTMFYGIYQDHVCSAVIRIARELFALIPVDRVLVKVIDPNNKGKDSGKYILSACIRREDLAEIDFLAIDPSSFILSVNHSMKFVKTRGFKQVDEVDLCGDRLEIMDALQLTREQLTIIVCAFVLIALKTEALVTSTDNDNLVEILSANSILSRDSVLGVIQSRDTASYIDNIIRTYERDRLYVLGGLMSIITPKNQYDDVVDLLRRIILLDGEYLIEERNLLERFYVGMIEGDRK